MAFPTGIQVIRYRTLRDCMAAYFHCRPKDLPRCGSWTWHDQRGKRHYERIQTSMKHSRQRGHWGWCEKKHILHLWTGRRAGLGGIITLVAHELGHCRKPFLPPQGEEMKAGRYEAVARAAFDIAKDLRKKRCGRRMQMKAKGA